MFCYSWYFWNNIIFTANINCPVSHNTTHFTYAKICFVFEYEKIIISFRMDQTYKDITAMIIFYRKRNVTAYLRWQVAQLHYLMVNADQNVQEINPNLAAEKERYPYSITETTPRVLMKMKYSWINEIISKFIFIAFCAQK